MEKNEVKLKGKIDQKRVISYLEDVVAGFKAGTICVQHGDNLVTLKPTSSFVELEMEAATKKDKERLTIELCWHLDKPEEENEFKIMAAEPVEQECAAGKKA